MRIIELSLGLSLALATGCGGSTARPVDGPPARAAGCAVEVVREGVPARPTRRLGEAVARCRGDAENDEARCTRVLQDQACQLGATVVWDLSASEMPEGGRRMRAAAGVYR